MDEGSLGSPADGIHDVTHSGGKRPSTSRKPDAQRAKRMRVSRACDQCRAGREKCDGAQPSCHTCGIQGRACTYNEQPKKRGIQPNYIRTLEATLAWLFQSFPEAETQLSHLLPNTNDPTQQAIAWKEPTSAEALHTTWRNGLICKQIDQMLSGSDIEVPGATDRARAATASRSAENTYQSPPLSALSELSNLAQDFRAPPPVSLDLQPRNAELSDLTLLRLPDNAWMLLEHYFAFTQTWLPIIERHDVLKLMYTYPATGLAFSDAIGAGHAELWSIMALASLQINGPSNILDSYRRIVKSLIPQEQGFQLGHIKALLVLALTELQRKSKIAAWLLIGSAVRLLTHLHLGKGTSTALFEGRTKHTILAAFLLETAIASHSGALCHIRADDIKSIGPLIEDGLEEWSPWPYEMAANSTSGAAKAPTRSISTFNCLIRTALQYHGHKRVSIPMPHNGGSQMDIVFHLLQNASAEHGRKHPSAVLSYMSSEREAQPQARSAQANAQGHSSHVDFSNPFTGHGYGLLGIPNETPDSLPGSTADDPSTVANTSDPWAGETSRMDAAQDNSHHSAQDTTSVTQSTDIFEELAMLDRSDSSQNPRFMQNLGFGPDLDLAEFFGADYQFSDLSTFGDLLEGQEGVNKDAG